MSATYPTLTISTSSFDFCRSFLRSDSSSVSSIFRSYCLYASAFASVVASTFSAFIRPFRRSKLLTSLSKVSSLICFSRYNAIPTFRSFFGSKQGTSPL